MDCRYASLGRHLRLALYFLTLSCMLFSDAPSFGATVEGSTSTLYFTDPDGNLDSIDSQGTMTVVRRHFLYGLGTLIPATSELWFGSWSLDQIVERDLSGEFHVTTLATRHSGLDIRIVLGPDHCRWFTESLADKIGRLCPNGNVDEFPIPGGQSEREFQLPRPKNHKNPSGIAVGADGNLWFAEVDSGKIGRITTAGVITEFNVPHGLFSLDAITAGPDGNIWFTAFEYICRITPGGEITEFATPSKPFKFGKTAFKNHPEIFSMTTGPDGNLWFTENMAAEGQQNGIGRITPAGVFTEYDDLSEKAVPRDIALGPDGNLWFLVDQWDQGQMKFELGRVTTQGKITLLNPERELHLP